MLDHARVMWNPRTQYRLLVFTRGRMGLGLDLHLGLNIKVVSWVAMCVRGYTKKFNPNLCLDFLTRETLTMNSPFSLSTRLDVSGLILPCFVSPRPYNTYMILLCSYTLKFFTITSKLCEQNP